MRRDLISIEFSISGIKATKAQFQQATFVPVSIKLELKPVLRRQSLLRRVLARGISLRKNSVTYYFLKMKQ